MEQSVVGVVGIVVVYGNSFSSSKSYKMMFKEQKLY